MARILGDLLTILLALIPATLVFLSGLYDDILYYMVIGGVGLIILMNLLTIVLSSANSESGWLYRFDFIAMLAGYLPIFGFIMGELLAADAIISALNWNGFIFGFYILFSVSLFILFASTMSKVPQSVAMLVSFPILIVIFGSKLILELWNIFFPPRMRELIPYLEVTRELFLNISIALADPKRLEAEVALASLNDLSGQVDELAEGYAIRKGVGQSIDVGLTVVVFAFLGVLSFLTDDLGIPTEVIALLFGSLALALSTFAGFFGPFYGLAGACKEYTLKHGNYRAASIYKVIENVFSIPFNVASAGFLFLDLPPIDADTLEDFKGELQEQLEEVTSNISSLLGRDRGAVPRKTQKMIAALAGSAETNLNKLDFRDLRQETAREFALTYFQHEFAWKPWNRKTAVKEFAQKYYFDQQTGEENLMLISDKIRLGQTDEDLVNNVMVTAALRSIVMMEEKYQSRLADLELGQTCTGLAFGARQFIKDHYKVETAFQRYSTSIYHFFMGLFAIPIVTVIAFKGYANRFFDEVVEAIADGLFAGGTKDHIKIRTREIIDAIDQLPSKLKKERKERTPEIVEERKEKRLWNIKNKFIKLVGWIWQVISFPFMVIYKSGRWIARRFVQTDSEVPTESFEEAVAHTALVAIYDELFKRLVMQQGVSMAY
ncbi:MAG: hypothetical protein ACXAE3_15225 [Candidatus Kariarchaeaceae archaeon]